MSKVFYDVNGNVAPFFRPGVTQVIAVGAASVPVPATFASSTRVLLVTSTTAAYVGFSAAPVALATHPIIPAGRAVYVVLPSSGMKLAALQVSAPGTMSVTEMAG